MKSSGLHRVIKVLCVFLALLTYLLLYVIQNAIITPTTIVIRHHYNSTQQNICPILLAKAKLFLFVYTSFLNKSSLLLNGFLQAGGWDRFAHILLPKSTHNLHFPPPDGSENFYEMRPNIPPCSQKRKTSGDRQLFARHFLSQFEFYWVFVVIQITDFYISSLMATHSSKKAVIQYSFAFGFP